jgi:hypothetical protein
MNEFDWEIKRVQNYRQMKEIMDANLRRTPEFYKLRMKLLDDFFAEHKSTKSPVDIAVILYGGLADAQTLAYHIEGNNLLFYRPLTSHRRVVDKSYLLGTPNPERTLLLFDQDIVTGNALKESLEYFLDLGYSRKKIFGYVDWGCKWRQYGTPELMRIDALLRRKK